jgi:hypothetical protein
LLNFENYITLKLQAAGLAAVSVTITHPSLPVAPPQPTPSVCRQCPLLLFEFKRCGLAPLRVFLDKQSS